MKLSTFKNNLKQIDKITFRLPNGMLVPQHFHVTELGKIDKQFIDYKGVVRAEEVISLQLWDANDYEYRLHPEKLLKIIALSEEHLSLNNVEIEIEYQVETINKYGLSFDGKVFYLVSRFTNCLEKDNCNISEKGLPKQKTSCFSPSSECC